MLVIAVPVVIFAIANRHWVTFSLDPWSQSDPSFSLNLPLFALMLGALFIGILIGGIAAWLNQRKWRRAARDARTELNQWQAHAQRQRDDAPAADPVPIAPHNIHGRSAD